MKQILVTIPVVEVHRKEFACIATDAEFTYVTPQTLTRKQVQEAQIILGNVPAAWIAASEKLEWLQLNSAGANEYTETGVLAPNTRLTNATGAYGLAISEHMLGILLVLQKRLQQYQRNQADHLWQDAGNVTSIYGSQTLVVGMGDIGGEFAQKMNALGSRVIGIRRNKTEKPDYLEALFQMEELDRLLPQMDIVALCLPNTKDTYGLFDRGRLSRMKKTAILLNVGRGTVIKTDDLCEMLNSGLLGGAGLDVTDPEPLPADHPLWEAKNALITPHVSGAYHLQETLERIIGISRDNLAAFYAQTEMKNLVDFETGYRKFLG